MGRAEKPLDPGAGPVQSFACDLRRLRQRAGGITYREMARRTPFSLTTLAHAAAGERLPTLPVVLAYVTACGGDRQEWERRWHQALAQDLHRPPEDDAAAPYPGLRRFQPEDHERFFGRDRLTAELIDLLRARRFAVLVGASGSGKSSLLRAGLIPALRGGNSPAPRPAAVRILTPGPRPLHDHAAALSPSGHDAPTATRGGEDGRPGSAGAGAAAAGRREDGGGDTVVIIDQFEEVFTLCHDPEERAGFLALVLAARQSTSRLRVVLAVRADFFGHCAEYGLLNDALRDATLLVAPMTRAELREAVVRPAAARGLIVERALTARILDEVGGEPGALPLMSHALLQTWRRRRGRALTLAAYEAAGGLQGAIAQTAEDLCTRLTVAQVALARRILLRLVAPGDGAPDTRRPADRAELGADVPGPARDVLEHLVRARLVTFDGSTAELTHEALITAWPRLHTWLEADRDRLRLHRALTQHARAWQQLGRDAGALYRGARLAAARQAFPADADTWLTPHERAFLDASITADTTERRALTRTAQRLRLLTAALSVLLLITLVATGVAYNQRQDVLSAQRKELSQRLAVQSGGFRATDTDLAALLAVQAYRASPTPEAVAAVYSAAANPLLRTLRLHDNQDSVAFSPDGHAVVTYGAASPRAHVIDAATGRTVSTFGGLGLSAASAAVSTDGRTLALVAGSSAVLGDTKTGTHQAVFLAGRTPLSFVAFTAPHRALVLDYTGNVWDLVTEHRVARLDDYTLLARSPVVSGDGRTLVALDLRGTVRSWDLLAGRGPRRTFAVPGFDAARPAAFSTDGRTLAVVDSHDVVCLWDAATGRRRTTLIRPGADVAGLAVSTDGRSVATIGGNHTIRLWDVRTGTLRATLTGHTGQVTSVSFSPDGGTLATASRRDGTVRLWRVDTPVEKRFPLPGGSVGATALSADGRLLAVARDDPAQPGTRGTVSLWDLAADRVRKVSGGSGQGFLALGPAGRTLAEQGSVGTDVHLEYLAPKHAGRLLPAHWGVDAAFSPSGRLFGLVGIDGAVRVWDTATGKPLAGRPVLGDRVSVVALGPDDRTLAYNEGARTRLWDIRSHRTERTFPPGDDAVPRTVSSLAFSPDGSRLAVAGSGRVRLWDTATGDAAAWLNTSASTMVFRPDGRVLATTGSDGTVLLWDTRTGSVRASLAGSRPVIAMAFGPGGRTLTVEHDDHTVHVWKTVLPGLETTLARVCRAVARDLTAQERSQYGLAPDTRPGCPHQPDDRR